MKAQYRIVAEILLFAMGIAILSFVVVNFQHIQNFSSDVSTRDQMRTVSNLVLSAIIKSSLSNNSLITVEIPTEIFDNIYAVSVFDKNRNRCDVGDECFLEVSNQYTNVSQQLFNISQTHNIIGSVVSSIGSIKISSNATHIVVGR